MKIAIFVEGYTELIFIRELLLCKYNYSVSIESRTLFNDFKMDKIPYDNIVPDSKYYFQIINCGGDAPVLDRILNREEFMWNAGYQKIIGLRDMYSRDYKKFSTTIDRKINFRFINGYNDTIKKRAKKPTNIHFFFSIMEIEAWFLGLHDIFLKLNTRLTPAFIKSYLGYDLSSIDPETYFFHPAIELEKIYDLVNEVYDKKQGKISAIASYLTIADYVKLIRSRKCSSFRKFFLTLKRN